MKGVGGGAPRCSAKSVYSLNSLQRTRDGGLFHRVAGQLEELSVGFADLLPRPGGGLVLGHIQMHDAAAVVGEDDDDEQDAEGCGWDGEEVHRRTLRQLRSKDVCQVGGRRLINDN
jgi:hypothetical protein